MMWTTTPLAEENVPLRLVSGSHQFAFGQGTGRPPTTSSNNGEDYIFSPFDLTSFFVRRISGGEKPLRPYQTVAHTAGAFFKVSVLCVIQVMVFAEQKVGEQSKVCSEANTAALR